MWNMAISSKWKGEEKKNKHDEPSKLTEIIPHPVGIKAKMQANMSVIDRGVIAIAMTMPAKASSNEMPWMKRNSSWKFTEIFWLKVNTCKTKDTRRVHVTDEMAHDIKIGNLIFRVLNLCCRPWRELLAQPTRSMIGRIPIKITKKGHKRCLFSYSAGWYLWGHKLEYIKHVTAEFFINLSPLQKMGRKII